MKATHRSALLLAAGAAAGIAGTFLCLGVFGPRRGYMRVDPATGEYAFVSQRTWSWTSSAAAPGPHSAWARENGLPEAIGHPMDVSMSSKGWWSPGVCISPKYFDVVLAIYSCPLPEDARVSLLREYHQDLIDSRRHSRDVIFGKWSKRKTLWRKPARLSGRPDAPKPGEAEGLHVE
jgi:hypothetical protein